MWRLIPIAVLMSCSVSAPTPEPDLGLLEDAAVDSSFGALVVDLPLSGPPHLRVPSSEPARRAAGLKALEVGHAALTAPELPGGEQGLEVLLGALIHAEFAHACLAGLSDAQATEAKRTTADLTERFMERCLTQEELGVCRLWLDRPHWPSAAVRAVVERRVLLGMNSEQVRASWGTPLKVIRGEERSSLCFDASCTRRLSVQGGRVVEIIDGEPVLPDGGAPR